MKIFALVGGAALLLTLCAPTALSAQNARIPVHVERVSGPAGNQVTNTIRQALRRQQSVESVGAAASETRMGVVWVRGEVERSGRSALGSRSACTARMARWSGTLTPARRAQRGSFARCAKAFGESSSPSYKTPPPRSQGVTVPPSTLLYATFSDPSRNQPEPPLPLGSDSEVTSLWSPSMCP